MSLRDACRHQALNCRSLGSPFTARLLNLAAGRLTDASDVGATLLAWDGDVTSDGQSVPLRLAGALHRLVLLEDEGLVPHWPPHETGDDALWSAVEEAFDRRRDEVLQTLSHAPQTNEVRRAAALIPVLHMLARQYDRPLALFELGASAGLNLSMDRFDLAAGATRFGPGDSTVALAPVWEGPRPEPASLTVASRRGVDLAPLSVTNDADRLRLFAYLWPDQPERRQRTEAAVDLSDIEVEEGDAGDWLDDALNACSDDVLPVIYHTVAWQYFPAASQKRAEEAMARVGADRPVARIGMEADSGRGAGLTLTTWPNGRKHALARVDFHGRWLDWFGPTSLG